MRDSITVSQHMKTDRLPQSRDAMQLYSLARYLLQQDVAKMISYSTPREFLLRGKSNFQPYRGVAIEQDVDSIQQSILG